MLLRRRRDRGSRRPTAHLLRLPAARESRGRRCSRRRWTHRSLLTLLPRRYAHSGRRDLRRRHLARWRRLIVASHPRHQRRNVGLRGGARRGRRRLHHARRRRHAHRRLPLHVHVVHPLATLAPRRWRHAGRWHHRTSLHHLRRWVRRSCHERARRLLPVTNEGKNVRLNFPSVEIGKKKIKLYIQLKRETYLTCRRVRDNWD